MRQLYQVEGRLRNNIGDVLQGIVAKAFLSDQAEVVDREGLNKIDHVRDGLLIANGWYMHDFESFPPPANVNPIYISVHIADSAMLRSPEIREHFKRNSPIGCRDKKTLKLFLGWGIPAYFSGCLTTTISLGQSPITQSNEVLLVDGVDHPVPDEICQKLEAHYNEPLVRVTHDPPRTEGDLEEYSEKAQQHMIELLKRYKGARKVITTKIHCGLPCLGIGANVMMIHSNPSDPRLNTVREFIPVLSFEQIKSGNMPDEVQVNSDALKIRQSFLIDIVEASVEVGYNILMSPKNKAHRKIVRRSRQLARVYRFGVKVLLAAGLGSQRLKKVYTSL
jgi:hypothetical protein